MVVKHKWLEGKQMFSASIKMRRKATRLLGGNSFTINTDELYTRKNFSGDKTTLLWGLLTIEDY